MKKIKTITSIMLIVVLVFAFNTTSFAYYYESFAHEAPGGTTGQWVSDTNVSSLSATSKPVYPNMVGFYYKPSTLKSLPPSFASNNDRSFFMYLMEDDIGNNDDYVKYYTGKFTGRTLNSITYSHACTSDSIEAARGVELYIKQYVGTVSGDTSKKYTTLFSFYYGID